MISRPSPLEYTGELPAALYQQGWEDMESSLRRGVRCEIDVVGPCYKPNRYYVLGANACLDARGPE